MPPSSPAPLLRVTEDGGRVAACFPRATALTEENAEAVGREFAALAGGRDRPQVALDLGGIAYLTSIALVHLLALDKRVRGAGGRLTLVNLQPQVRQVFVVARLDRVLDIGPSPAAIPA